MAHKIDQTKTEKGAFIAYQQPAWHNLGTVFQREINVSDALKEGGLDFTVCKEANIHRIPFNTDIVSEDSFFTYRSDTNGILGTKLGADYTIFQNSQALDFVQEILDRGTAKIETAGSINGGRRVFICLKNTKEITVGDNDMVHSYALITTSHDGSLAVTAMPTNVRVVCNNTLSAALAGVGAIKIRHTSNANGRMAEALKVMGLLTDSQQQSEDVYNTMRETIIDQNAFFDYVGNIFMSADEIKDAQAGKMIDDLLSTRKQNTLKDVLAFANTGIGQAQSLNNGKMNMWTAYNAVTGYLTSKKYSTADDRMTSLIFGDSAKKIAAAGTLAMAPANVQSIKRNPTANISLN
jgi:phage/plasmid-like protein (TIGR03299 family)